MFFQKKKALRSWINVDLLDFRQVARLPNSVDFFKEQSIWNIMDMVWDVITSDNINFLELIQFHRYDASWRSMSKNPGAISLLEKNQEKIDWLMLCSNPEAAHLIKDNLHRDLCWHSLSKNPNAIEILKKHPENIIWYDLSANPNAMELLEANPDRINWFKLSANRNPRAIKLLRENVDLDRKSVV